MKIGPSPFGPGAVPGAEPERERGPTAQATHGHGGPRHAERRSSRPPGAAPPGGKSPLRPRRPPPTRQQAGTDALGHEENEREPPAADDDLRLRTREQAGEREDHPGRGEDERARRHEQARLQARSAPGVEPAAPNQPGQRTRSAYGDAAATAAALRAAINPSANPPAGARPAHGDTHARIRRVMSACAGAPATLEQVKKVLIESAPAAAAAAGRSPSPARQNLNALLPLMMLVSLQPRTAGMHKVALARLEALEHLALIAPAKLPPPHRS